MGAELIKVPLIQLSKPAGSELQKRSMIGFSSLTDDVFPGQPNFDFAYLGEVGIGTPPQNFLLRKLPFFRTRFDESSIRVQVYFGLRIRIVGVVIRLPRNYSIRVHHLRMCILDRILTSFMEQVLYFKRGNSENRGY